MSVDGGELPGAVVVSWGRGDCGTFSAQLPTLRGRHLLFDYSNSEGNWQTQAQLNKTDQLLVVVFVLSQAFSNPCESCKSVTITFVEFNRCSGLHKSLSLHVDLKKNLLLLHRNTEDNFLFVVCEYLYYRGLKVYQSIV